MSGICDTCKRNQVCRKPMDGMDSCRLYVSGKKSNYEKLFGTPERAARVIVALNNCRVTDCIDCWARGACEYFGEGGDYDKLLEWLRGDSDGE